MTQLAHGAGDDRVSRRRYERERAARKQAEVLLEEKSRALFEANAALTAQATALERAVQDRTAELEAAKTVAESSNSAKSGFLAMISHEIRTPLNGVLGMATVLAECDLPEDQQEMVATIQSSGTSLLDLLNDMLDLSKIEANKMELEERDFDFDAFCRQTLKVFEPQAEAKRLSLELCQEGEAQGWIRSDPTRLRQVIANLVSNALKFTDKGGVLLNVSRTGDMLTLQVRDTGAGVPPDKQDRLFEAFAQTDASITRRFGGTGLGLAISRQICRLMGGDLVYRALPEGGSCLAANVRIANSCPKAPAQHEGNSQNQKILEAHPWRILVAEDSETNQRVIRLLLRRYPLKIHVVGDGAAAVEAHFETPYDLILMDVNMPVMNGLEAAAMIRQVETARNLPYVPIVALTANAMTHQVSSYLRQGIDAHVAKPVKREELTGCMARLLRSQAE